jgi:hypothetical protein
MDCVNNDDHQSVIEMLRKTMIMTTTTTMAMITHIKR